MNPAENLRHDEAEQPIAETELTPEQLQTQILSEIMEKYGIDMGEYVRDQSILNLTELRNEISEGGNIDEIKNRESENIYKLHLEENPEKYRNIDKLGESINSTRLNDSITLFEGLIDKEFESYEFLGKVNSNLKLALINGALKGDIGENINATLGSFIQTFGSFDTIVNSVISSRIKENDSPTNSGRTKAFEELWSEFINPYKEKFDEINVLFTENSNITEEQQKIIIGNMDWFRNPNMIENGVDGLIIGEIDLTNLDNLNEIEYTDQENEKLINYAMKSRENLVKLAKKLETGNAPAEFVYGLINTPGLIGEKAKGLVEMLLKIPMIGDMLSVFLGLNPDNPIEELNENSRNIKLFNALKGLGETKGENGEINEGKGIFKNKDLKNLNFNALKNEMRTIINLDGIPINSDKYGDFWEEAFKDEGYGNEIKIKFKLTDEQKIKESLSTSEMKDILKNGINEYKNNLLEIQNNLEDTEETEGENESDLDETTEIQETTELESNETNRIVGRGQRSRN